MTIDDYRSIAQVHGSPCYIFDLSSLDKRVSSINAITGGHFNLCYSIKANPFLVSYMSNNVSCLEVCSPGELKICMGLHIDPNNILYSGVSKTFNDINEALQYGVRSFTAESIMQAETLEKCVSLKDINISCLLRLASDTQFGMSENDIRFLLSSRKTFPHVSFEGIHYFAGTQRKKLNQQISELEMLKDVIFSLRNEYNIPLPKLEYGPGLSVPLFEGEDFSDTLKPFQTLFESFAEASTWSDLTVEMGRFFVTECGHYITRVMDTKSNGDINYAIVDGGINHINYYGSMVGMKIPIMDHIKYDVANTTQTNWCICGSLCTTSDYIIRKKCFIGLSVGDLLVFHNIGAYSITEGLYLFLSRTMPKVLLMNTDGSITIARDFLESYTINTVKNN